MEKNRKDRREREKKIHTPKKREGGREIGMEKYRGLSFVRVNTAANTRGIYSR